MVYEIVMVSDTVYCLGYLSRFTLILVSRTRRCASLSCRVRGLLLIHPLRAILNSFVNDIFERIATEASSETLFFILSVCQVLITFPLELASYSKKSTISSREIQTSVRLILPGELSKHAISEGTKSVTSMFIAAYISPSRLITSCYRVQRWLQISTYLCGLLLTLLIHICFLFFSGIVLYYSVCSLASINSRTCIPQHCKNMENMVEIVKSTENIRSHTYSLLLSDSASLARFSLLVPPGSRRLQTEAYEADAYCELMIQSLRPIGKSAIQLNMR